LADPRHLNDITRKSHLLCATFIYPGNVTPPNVELQKSQKQIVYSYAYQHKSISLEIYKSN